MTVLMVGSHLALSLHSSYEPRGLSFATQYLIPEGEILKTKQVRSQ